MDSFIIKEKYKLFNFIANRFHKIKSIGTY